MNRAYQPTWVTDQLAVGAAPMSHAQLDSLREQGIGAILNLCGEFCDLHDIECAAGFEVYHLPLADEEAPELEALEKALEWLDEAIFLGKKVLIHCRHGIGRTGTVLNAYLLRRGLGHRLAWLKLRPLRSKPANFSQWWTVRQYGRKSPKLNVREPALEMSRAVDLGPYFHVYEALAARVDALFALGQARCGQDHARCCQTPIRMSLAEAVHVTHRLNTHLSSAQRLGVISRAVACSRKERELAPAAGGGAYCLSDVETACPLLEDGRCMLYAHRPLQCRAHGIDDAVLAELWETILAPSLEHVSLEVWMAFAGCLARESLPHFSFSEVLSGRYVQALFHMLVRCHM